MTATELQKIVATLEATKSIDGVDITNTPVSDELEIAIEALHIVLQWASPKESNQ